MAAEALLKANPTPHRKFDTAMQGRLSMRNLRANQSSDSPCANKTNSSGRRIARSQRMNTLTRRHFIRSSSMGAGALLVSSASSARRQPQTLERLEGATKPLMTDAFVESIPTPPRSDESRRVRQQPSYDLAMMMRKNCNWIGTPSALKPLPPRNNITARYWGLTQVCLNGIPSFMRTAGAKTERCLPQPPKRDEGIDTHRIPVARCYG